jgi:hypothetical protein
MPYPEFGHLGFKVLCVAFGFAALSHSDAHLNAKEVQNKYLKEIAEVLKSKTDRK